MNVDYFIQHAYRYTSTPDKRIHASKAAWRRARHMSHMRAGRSHVPPRHEHHAAVLMPDRQVHHPAAQVAHCEANTTHAMPSWTHEHTHTHHAMRQAATSRARSTFAQRLQHAQGLRKSTARAVANSSGEFVDSRSLLTVGEGAPEKEGCAGGQPIGSQNLSRRGADSE